MNTLELRFQYIKDEYVKAERQFLIANKIIHKYDLVLAVIFLLLSIAGLFFFSFNIFSILVFIIIVVAIAAGSYSYFLLPLLKFKQITKHHNEYSLIFSKDTIYFKSLGIESKIKWAIYTSLWDNQDFYYLIKEPRMYTLIPKRIFKSQNEKQIFEELVQANIHTTKHI